MATRRCNVCKEEKPVTEFFRQAATKSGYQSRCKTCDYRRKRIQRVGLTVEQFDVLDLSACEVCFVRLTNEASSRPHLDHCHTTGKFRGVLCVRCNIALGQVNDDVGRLRALIAYLEKHSEQ